LPNSKNFLIEKRWALLAIFLGTALGFISAIICIAWNLIIFGFNIMYIVSPLLAGVVETTIASKKYGKSTGAISALFTFLLINGYGWFGPGWIFPKEPVTLSLITIIAIVLTIQAAFPIFVNHILFVVVPGIVARFMRVLVRTPSEIIQLTSTETEGGIKQADEIFLDQLTTPLVSVPDVNNEKIESYVGLAIGEALAEEKGSQGRFQNLVKIIEPAQLENFNLGEAKKVALSRMLENAESMGANGVVEVIIDFVSMGGIQGSVTIVTATGTAVIFHKEMEDVSESKGNVSRESKGNKPEEGNISEKIPGNDETPEMISNGGSVGNGEIRDNKIDKNVSSVLSQEIDHFVNEEMDNLRKNLKLATKSFLDQELEKRFLKVSRDFDMLENS